MTENERRKAFSQVTQRELRNRARLMTDTYERVVELLGEADRRIRVILASQPTDYQRWSLTQLQREIQAALAELGNGAGASASGAAGRAWESGQQLIDAPLHEAGASLRGVAPVIDTRQLLAMRAFMVDRIKDISVAAGRQIGTELGLVVIGTQPPSEAIGKVAALLGEPSRARAQTIVRTELGRVYAVAAQTRLGHVADRVPGMKKKWRKSGKLHPREHHAAANGQVQNVDDPFVLVGPRGVVKLMFPHDPGAAASETINCGCVSVPWRESWGEIATLPDYRATPGLQRAR